MTDTGPAMSAEETAMLQAAVDMLGRTGCSQFQLRYQDDDEPTIWMAAVAYPPERTGAKRTYWEAQAALHPLAAVLRLCEKMMDGGMCTHCKRPTGFTEHFDEMPLDQLVCWYQWDPSTKDFRRGCQGDAP